METNTAETRNYTSIDIKVNNFQRTRIWRTLKRVEKIQNDNYWHKSKPKELERKFCKYNSGHSEKYSGVSFLIHEDYANITEIFLRVSQISAIIIIIINHYSKINIRNIQVCSSTNESLKADIQKFH